MAGLLPAGRDQAEGERVYIDNLRLGRRRGSRREGMTVIIEPINNRDIPGYFLNYDGQAMRVIERVGHPNLQAAARPLSCADHGGRSRASACARSPATTRMSRSPATPAATSRMSARSTTRILFDLFDELGYSGWIGCEYRPKGETRPGSAGQEIRDRLDNHGSCRIPAAM